MKAKTFLLAASLAFILFLAAYVVLVKQYVLLERTVPSTYGQFLLEASADFDGKVIVESGSNSVHGLDAVELSDYFAAPVFIVADNAGYPLRKKYYRLREALRPGDVLILPLEWNMYSQSEWLASTFVSRVADDDLWTSHYIKNLPMSELFTFILGEYPLRHTFEAFMLTRNSLDLESRSIKSLNRHTKKLRQGGNVSLGAMVKDGPVKMPYGVAIKGTCDRYLFKDSEGFQMKVSDTFRDNAKLFAELQAEGVAVYFSWPAVVDWPANKCYSAPEIDENLEQYVEEIREVLHDNGLQILGDPADSHFPAECFLNSSYHMRWSCAQKRTSRFIEQLVMANVQPLNAAPGETQIETLLMSTLDDWRSQLGNPPVVE